MRRFRGDPCAPIRRNLERLMERKRVTRQQVERAASLSTGHLYYFLTGKIRVIDVVTLCLVARALDVELEELAPRDQIAALFDAEIAAPLKAIAGGRGRRGLVAVQPHRGGHPGRPTKR